MLGVDQLTPARKQRPLRNEPIKILSIHHDPTMLPHGRGSKDPDQMAAHDTFVRKAPQSRVVLRALKRYGAIVADNSAPWFVSGAPAKGWSNDDLHSL